MKNCPVCGVVGQPVPRETVLAMVKEQRPLDCKYWLCLTPSCPVAYYGRGGEIWRQTQIRVPIAQKDGARPKYVCYCSGVTEQDIINAVISKKALTLTEAIAITGATGVGDCKINNPAGICCSTAFKEAFARAVELSKRIRD
jgi:bacterioferritin-associated ferredoxin